MVRRLLALVIALTLLAPVAHASEPDAMTRSAARKLAEEGDRLFEQGDFEGAAERFAHAYGLIDAPTLGVRWARSLSRMGRLVEASERYRKTAATPVDGKSPRAFAEAVEQAAAELEALEPRIPMLRISREDGVGTVSLDGKPLSDSHLNIDLPVDPGGREVSADGALSQTIYLDEGDRIEVTLSPHAQPPPKPQPVEPEGIGVQRGLAYAAYGVGLVGLGFGIGFGLSAVAQDADLSDQCSDGGDCTYSGAQDDIDSLETAGTISTVGFVAAGVGAILGTVLLVSEPEPTSARGIGVYVGALEGGLRGVF